MEKVTTDRARVQLSKYEQRGSINPICIYHVLDAPTRSARVHLSCTALQTSARIFTAHYQTTVREEIFALAYDKVLKNNQKMRFLFLF